MTKCGVFFILILFFLFAAINGNAWEFENDLQMALYRTFVNWGDKTSIGTAVCFSDSILGRFFVTARHVAINEGEQGKISYADSVTFYRNEFDGKDSSVFSGSNYHKVAIIPGTTLFEFEKGVDLVIILPCDHYRSSKIDLGWPSLKSEIILNRSEIFKLINIGSKVRIIGFEPSFIFDNDRRYCISRFGEISLVLKHAVSFKADGKIYRSEIMLLDIVSRLGDSGGPVILVDNNNIPVVILGIVAATNVNTEMSFVFPFYYVREKLDSIWNNVPR